MLWVPGEATRQVTELEILRPVTMVIGNGNAQPMKFHRIQCLKSSDGVGKKRSMWLDVLDAIETLIVLNKSFDLSDRINWTIELMSESADLLKRERERLAAIFNEFGRLVDDQLSSQTDSIYIVLDMICKRTYASLHSICYSTWKEDLTPNDSRRREASYLWKKDI